MMIHHLKHDEVSNEAQAPMTLAPALVGTAPSSSSSFGRHVVWMQVRFSLQVSELITSHVQIRVVIGRVATIIVTAMVMVRLALLILLVSLVTLLCRLRADLKPLLDIPFKQEPRQESQ